jgi:hypothetical protein
VEPRKELFETEEPEIVDDEIDRFFEICAKGP